MKIVVLERHSVGADVDVSCFKQLGDVDYYENTLESEIAERIKEADIVIANKSKLNEKTLKDAKNVKYIAEFATGFDNVDIEYCNSRGIKVSNVRNYSTQAVAQHTFAMLFYLLEHLPFYDEFVKSGKYAAQDKFSVYDRPFTELDNKTWGIIGMGNIGKAVARIATAFGARVIHYSVTGNTSDEYTSVDFDTLLRESDFISLHCPLSEKTKYIIDKDALAKMKPTAYLLNVARGKVVNNRDLAEALENNVIAGAGLDVVEEEPILDTNPLCRIKSSEKLIITPHIGWASTEARQRCVDIAYNNVKTYLEGNPENLVN